MSNINLDLRPTILISIAGCCVIIGGSLTSITWLKWVGIILAVVGMAKTGQRLYNRMREKGVNKV